MNYGWFYEFDDFSIDITDPAIQDHAHEYRQSPFPNPAAKGKKLRDIEQINGALNSHNLDYKNYKSHRYYTGPHGSGISTDLMNLKPINTLRDPAFGNRQFYDDAYFAEVNLQPYMTLYPLEDGCEELCLSLITWTELNPSGLTLEDELIFSTGITGVDSIGYALYQDETEAGLLFWYNGSYKYYNFADETYELKFSSSVFLSSTKLFGKVLLGNDYKGDVYLVTLTGLLYIGNGSSYHAIKDEYIIIDDGLDLVVYDLLGVEIVVGITGDIPSYSLRSFTQNYLANKDGLQWATAIGTSATIMLHDAPEDPEEPEIVVADIDGRYTHRSLYLNLTRDWIKKADCPTAKRFPLYTPRYPCTDIVVDPKTRLLATTMKWSAFVASEIVFDGPMHKLHRLGSIGKIGSHEVDISYTWDSNAGSNNAVINVKVHLVNYN